jgi:hypothetical protein
MSAWIGGVILPVTLLIADPVFRDTMFPIILILGASKPFRITAIGCCVLAVIIHLLLKKRSAILAGMLASAALTVLAFGFVLLPLGYASLIGVIALVPFGYPVIIGTGLGLLVLSYFVSAIVVGWRARKAFEMPGVFRSARALLGSVLFFGLCAAIQWRATTALTGAVQDISTGQPELAAAGTARIARWSLLIDLDPLVQTWRREEDETRRRYLADAYKSISGDDIEERARTLAD